MKEQDILLVINCGSSSLKYEVLKFPEQVTLGKGVIECIGNEISIFTHQNLIANRTSGQNLPIANHKEAFNVVNNILTDSEHGIIDSPKNITAVGHRVVHGGEKYGKSVIIDDTVTQAIQDLASLAPLHNPANLIGIESAMKIFSYCPHVAVFDTAYHQTLPEHAFMYPLPYDLCKQHHIRRYGFHGTSHYYVAKQAAHILNKKLEKCNLVTCHLGNGSSITAIKNGKSIDTSMGLTPLGGLMMGTRSGDIDPAVIAFLHNQGISIQDIEVMCNKKSGLLGISGISNDIRDISKEADTNPRAALALEMFAHNAKKFIGAYVAELGQVDMLVFTAGIGQFAVDIRQKICESLKGLNIFIAPERNIEVGGTSGIISTDKSPVKIAVIPTNEELQIALDAYELAHAK